MSWDVAMRWANYCAQRDGVRYRVRAYWVAYGWRTVAPFEAVAAGRWAYRVSRAEGRR